MKSIKFSDKELEFLRQQYTAELAEAEDYVEQIKAILKKLNVSSSDENIELLQKESKKGRGKEKKHKVQVTEPKQIKRRGRKPKTAAELDESTTNVETGKSEKTSRPGKTKELKKRGRKPKSVVAPELVSAQTPDQIIVSVKEKVEKKPSAKRIPKPKAEPVNQNESSVSTVPIAKRKASEKKVGTKVNVKKQKPAVKKTDSKQNKKAVNKEVTVNPVAQTTEVVPVIGTTEESNA